ncbi:MAG TPA: phosphotransferase [Arthrobacter sp.]
MTALALLPVTAPPAPAVTELPVTWAGLRSPAFGAHALELIRTNAPAGMEVTAVTHIRTAHYAVYRADTLTGSFAVRIGITDAADDEPTANTAFLGTSAVTPTGQVREYRIAGAFAAAGADVAAPEHYTRTSALDLLWVPFLNGDARPITAAQWHRALTGLQAWRPKEELPVFTNRVKSFTRLDDLPEETSIGFRNRYDTQLEALFEAASHWSVVHGDAHSGNALTVEDRTVLYDFDTVCWAPSVWDLTHLLHRAGRGTNTGYTAAGLAALFPYGAAEVAAALELRRTAALIAKAHWEHETPVATGVPIVAAV